MFNVEELEERIAPRWTRGESRYAMLLAALLTCLLMGVMLAGCTHNQTTLDGGITARTSEASLASLTADGDLEAAYHGIAPTQLMQDPNGNWLNMPGATAVLSVPMPDGGVAYIVSPNDTKIAKITFKRGETNISVEGLEANISEPMSQQVAALQIALPVLRDMSKEEALATVEKWKIAKEITPTVADLLAQIIAMW